MTPEIHALALLVRQLCQLHPAHAAHATRAAHAAPGAALPATRDAHAAPGAAPPAPASAIPDHLVRLHFLAPLAARAGLVRFRHDHIASSLLAELRARTLAEAVDALAAHAIPVILLKGISYASSLYADPAERPMSDIDLLVPPADHARATRVLYRLGYWAAGSPAQASRLHHAVSLKRRDAAVDLHRSILQSLRSRMDVRALWRRARPARERTDGALRLDAVDEAVVHLAHAARHELRVPAINYVDAARLIARAPGGAPAILERARSARLGRAVRAALRMTGAIGHGLPLDWRILPHPHEILALAPMSRARQLVRKLALVDGPTGFLGLAVTTAHGHIAHRWRP